MRTSSKGALAFQRSLTTTSPTRWPASPPTALDATKHMFSAMHVSNRMLPSSASVWPPTSPTPSSLTRGAAGSMRQNILRWTAQTDNNYMHSESCHATVSSERHVLWLQEDPVLRHGTSVDPSLSSEVHCTRRVTSHFTTTGAPGLHCLWPRRAISRTQTCTAVPHQNQQTSHARNPERPCARLSSGHCPAKYRPGHASATQHC